MDMQTTVSRTTRQVVLLSMGDSRNTSGVTRFLAMYLRGMAAYPEYEVLNVRFDQHPDRIFVRRHVYPTHTELVIPLPPGVEELVRHRYWMRAYNDAVLPYVLPYLRPGCLLHLHTLNVIDLALLIRRRVPCRIVSHLHCIPWKSHFNGRRERFNRLYDGVYNGGMDAGELRRSLQGVSFEMAYYHEADRVVCVTECAADFLRRYMDVPAERIAVIPNGIEDAGTLPAERPSHEGPVRLLFVGVLSESKGIGTVLRALQLLMREGRAVELYVCGRCPEEKRVRFGRAHPGLPVRLLGLLSYAELTALYRSCDIGVIASLQEQCSYAALEMMMHGLPVVTTLVDGLGELFRDGTDALGVGTRFSPVLGLSADVEQMARQIGRLIDDAALRRRLGQEARRTFERRYTLPAMMARIAELYREMEFPLKTD